MATQRIGGIKYNMERLTDGELETMRGHLLEQHVRLVGEIALIETTMFARQQPQLPIDQPEASGNAG